MQLKSFLILASFFVCSFAQTSLAQVESDINNVGLKLSAVVTVLEAFPTSGGTLDQVMALHSADIDVNNALVAFTDDITRAACPFSDIDALTLLTSSEDNAPDVLTALTNFVTLKPEFDTLGATSLILQDLTMILGSGNNSGAALAACVSVRHSQNPVGAKIDVNQSNVAPAVEQFVASINAVVAPVLSDFA